MPKPAFSNTDTMPMLATNQLANAMDLAINADTVNRLPWVLSGLGFTGTPEEQLNSAIETMGTVTNPTAHQLLHVDIDIDLTDTLIINRPNLTIKASNRRAISISSSAAFQAMTHLITISADNVSLEGFNISANGAASTTVVRTQSTNTRIYDNDISNIDVDTVMANNANNVGSCFGVGIANVSGANITSGCSVKSNNIHDVATGIAGTFVASDVSVRKNKIRDYSQRGMFFTGNDDSELKIIDNDIYLPANVALSTGGGVATGAIRQPVAVQRNTGKLIDIQFSLNRFHGNGEPFRNNNSADSPGEDTDVPSQSAADVFSFHACTGFIFGNVATGGGEVGIAIANHCENLFISGNVINGTDASGIFVGGTVIAEACRDITVHGNAVFDCCLDQAGDHSSSIAGIHLSNSDRLTSTNNTVTSTSDRPDAWSIDETYSVGDVVYFPFDVSEIASDSGLKSWTAAVDSDFVPGFVFRFNSDLFEVPTGFTGGKGTSFDADEEARYTPLGTLPELGVPGEYRSYVAVASSTGVFPPFDVNEVSWEPIPQSVSASASWIFGCTNVVDIGNVGVNLLRDNPTRVESSTFVETDGFHAAKFSDFPVMSDDATNNRNIPILDTEDNILKFYRDGSWSPAVIAGGSTTIWSAYTNVTGFGFVNYENVDSVSLSNTNEYLFTLSVDLPNLNYPFSISSYDTTTRTYRISTPALNQVLVRVFNSNGTIATTSNFAISAVS